MSFRKKTVVAKCRGPAANFFHIVAVANPFGAHRRKPLRDIASKIGIAPRTAGVVHAHRFVDFYFAVDRFCRSESDLSKRNSDVFLQCASDVNLLRIWKLTVTLAHKKFELRKQETGISSPGFLIVLFTNK